VVAFELGKRGAAGNCSPRNTPKGIRPFTSPSTDERDSTAARAKHQVAHEIVTEVDVRPRTVVALGPGVIPKAPSGKQRPRVRAGVAQLRGMAEMTPTGQLLAPVTSVSWSRVVLKHYQAEQDQRAMPPGHPCGFQISGGFGQCLRIAAPQGTRGYPPAEATLAAADSDILACYATIIRLVGRILGQR
jgi:hypothetical protein